jgi:tetratricopeptide (TPR) repeat protein
MQFDSDEFDPQQFDPGSSTEEQCWAAIPFLEGATKALTLNHLGGLAYEREDFRKASVLADQAANEWQRLGHDDEAAKCYSNAGSCLRTAGDIEEAIPFYATAAALAGQAGNEEMYAQTNVILGSMYDEIYEIEKALEYFETAYKAAQNAESATGQIHALEGIGVAYINLGNLEMALDILQEGFDLSSQEGKTKHSAAFRAAIAECHMRMNRPDLAIDEINAARELALMMNDHLVSCERGNLLSAVHRELGNFETAIEIADEVKQAATLHKFPKHAAEASANIGHALNRLGQYESAYQLLTSAAEIMKMGGDFPSAVVAEADAAHAALGMGNVPLAQLRLAGCEQSAEKINLLRCHREYDINDRHSMLSLVKFQLTLQLQLASSAGAPFQITNPNMEELFELENKPVYLENQDIVNSIVALKPEFIIAGGVPAITSPEGELLTKCLAELIDEKYFITDPKQMGRFHEIQWLVRREFQEGIENLSLAIAYYLEAGMVDKASELSGQLQAKLLSRSEISRARAINSRIY